MTTEMFGCAPAVGDRTPWSQGIFRYFKEMNFSMRLSKPPTERPRPAIRPPSDRHSTANEPPSTRHPASPRPPIRCLNVARPLPISALHPPRRRQ